MQNRAIQCTILPPIRILASPARGPAEPIEGELSDSAHQKNVALRFHGGRYNLNYG
jgi:hypothetical protein